MKPGKEKLESYSLRVIDCIVKNLPSMPYGIRYTCKQLVLSAGKKFDLTEKQRYLMVSSLVILRYFNPALLCPDVFGIIDREVSNTVRRPLVLVYLPLIPLSSFSSETNFPHYAALKNHPKLCQRYNLWRERILHGTVQWNKRKGSGDPQRILPKGDWCARASRILCGSLKLLSLLLIFPYLFSIFELFLSTYLRPSPIYLRERMIFVTLSSTILASLSHPTSSLLYIDWWHRPAKK